MKTIVTVNNSEGAMPISWYFLPDSALTNAGKPFYIPESMQSVEASMVMAVRLTRLGKTIAPRFANRYFEEAAFGVHFQSPSLMEYLTQHSLPKDRARGFDRSLILSDFISKFKFSPEEPIILHKNKEEVLSLSPDLSDATIGPTLASVSTDNTMKMGDLLIPLSSDGISIAPGDVLEIMKGNECLLRTEIK